jgi:hypothetical protein
MMNLFKIISNGMLNKSYTELLTSVNGKLIFIRGKMGVGFTQNILIVTIKVSDWTVPDGCCWIFLSLCPLLSTQILPFKYEIPIKATPQVS